MIIERVEIVNMDTFLILIIFFVVVLVGAIITYIYLKNDESKIKEVDDAQLSRLGKDYTKIEFENTMSSLYFEILEGLGNDDYGNLRDIVSDQEYNKMLAEKKNEKDKNVINKITNIKKQAAKLLDLKIINDLEVAKLLVEYTSVDYALGNREETNEEGETEVKQVVIAGDDTKPVFHKFILTFVRNRTDNEKIKCPTCGYENHLLTKAKCLGCDTLIIPKKMHWVYTGRVTTNMEK